MPLQELKFSINGTEHSFWADAEWNSFPGELAEIIEGQSYPFFDDVRPNAILDIGANIGIYSLLCSLIWPEAVIHAYEPEPDNYLLLWRNISSNPLAISHYQAVGPTAGRRELYLSGESGMCHSLFQRTGEDQKTVMVDVVAAKDLPVADLVKLDIEGPELQVLQAMDLSAVNWLYVEFHSEHDRLAIDNLLIETFFLRHARISRRDVGEVMYQRRVM